MDPDDRFDEGLDDLNEDGYDQGLFPSTVKI